MAIRAQAYTLIRSDRKTMCLQVTRDLTVVVRAPKWAAKRDIDGFVAAHADWIDAHLEARRKRAESDPEPTEAEAAALVERARAVLPGRVKQYADRMGLYPTGIRITSARTRYGSCSGKNSLCFSYLLMRRPDAAIDYVVVHELAHIRHKNHGQAFYALVEQVLPDWRARRALL